MVTTIDSVCDMICTHCGIFDLFNILFDTKLCCRLLLVDLHENSMESYIMCCIMALVAHGRSLMVRLICWRSRVNTRGHSWV